MGEGFFAEVQFLFSTATLVSPQPRIQKFLPVGNFLNSLTLTLTPHCPSLGPQTHLIPNGDV